MKSRRRYFRRRKNDIRRSRASGSRSTPIKTIKTNSSEVPQPIPPLQQPSESSTLPRAMHPSASTNVPGNPPVLQQPDASRMLFYPCCVSRLHNSVILHGRYSSPITMPNSAYFNVTGLSLKSVGQLRLMSISHGASPNRT